MKSNIAITIAFMFAMTFVSCKKFLDAKSDKALVIPQTLNDFQGLLDDQTVMNMVSPSRGETASDDYFLLKSTFDTRPDFQQNAYTWTPDDYYFQNDWSLNYVPVYNTNVCLEGLKKIPVTTSNKQQWNQVEGAAYFFRAYSFLNLLWVYAKAYDSSTYNSDPGIVLRLNSDFNILSVRSSVKESYEQVISDAMNAALYLPDNIQSVMRPSRAAAYGLLARAYLSMRVYDSAGKYADKALHLKGDLLDYNNTDLVNISINVPFNPYNNEIVFYTQTNSSMKMYSTSYALIDTVLYSMYENDDIRKWACFKANGSYFQYKGSYAASTNQFFSGIATDELYLIRAECNTRDGQLDEALSDLNVLLKNRYEENSFIPVTTTSSNELLTIILNERRKELLMRGLRWIDIKRLNKESAGIIPKRVIGDKSFTLQPNENRYALPLPADIINLSGILQN